MANLWSLFYGFQEATCALVGNCIGNMDAPLAKRYFSGSVLLSYIFVAIIIIMLKVFEEPLFSIFKTDGIEDRITRDWDFALV